MQQQIKLLCECKYVNNDYVALRPDDQRVSQFGKLKLPSLRAKGDVATGAKLGNDD